MSKNNSKTQEEEVKNVEGGSEDQDVQNVNEEAQEEGQEIVTPSAEEKKSGDKDSITIKSPGTVPNGPHTGHLRTFSKADHGKDFKKVAEDYRAKFDGEVV